MSALITGFIVGFLMCIPVGPINIYVVNTQIRRSKSEALAIAVGGSIMDFAYFIVILSGLSLLHFSDSFSILINILGIVLVFVLGLKELKTTNIQKEKISRVATKSGLIASLLLGMFIYISNPTLVLTMTALASFIKGLHLFEFSMINIIFLSSSLSVGGVCWFIFLVSVVNKYEKTIREKYLLKFTRISGFLMILISIIMSYRLYKIIRI